MQIKIWEGLKWLMKIFLHFEAFSDCNLHVFISISYNVSCFDNDLFFYNEKVTMIHWKMMLKF